MTFVKDIKRIINSGSSRSIVLTGNVHDLYFDGNDYVPIIDLLKSNFRIEPNVSKEQRGLINVVYELNSPIQILDNSNSSIHEAWKRIHSDSKSLNDRLKETTSNPTYALEILRQMAEINRNHNSLNNLFIIIESADMLIPDSEISRMNMVDRRNVAIVNDWVSDPSFLNGGDTVVFISESKSNLHHRISRLPQILSIEVPLPNLAEREHFLTWFYARLEGKNSSASTIKNVSSLTSGLSIHALRQLVLSGDVSNDEISKKVEEYMVSQLGEGVIEFKRPTHRMKSVIGNSIVKKFMIEELIPDFSTGDISGAAVGGPIGGGKTYICEAVAAELGIPVITLKNIRSKWFGETDKIFERLQRLLECFHKIVIFVDEADSQFGSIQDGHETEKRLTGKIQAMMSDIKLKGRVIWFLMTARIHLLSPDIRRPGRMDVIIPILDPEGEDRIEFIKWTFSSVLKGKDCVEELNEIIPKNSSAAMFSMMKSAIKGCSGIEEAKSVINDMILPDIEETRDYQTLQAKINCTRKSLLFVNTKDIDIEEHRKNWKHKIKELEMKGIR